MEIKEIFKNINWKSFIIGAALFAFIVVLGIDYDLEFILVFSSIGLLYIGYKSQNFPQACVLGALGTLPLFIVTVTTERLGKISGENITIWILLSFLVIGAFCSFVGAYFNKSRQKAIKMQTQKGKGKKKNNKK